MINSFSLIKKTVGMAIVLFFGAACAEDYSQWTYHQAVILNTSATGANVASTIVNFPVLVRLDSTHNASVFAQARNQGADLRFSTATGTSLHCQIEQWDSTAKTAAVWVLVDIVRSPECYNYMQSIYFPDQY